MSSPSTVPTMSAPENKAITGDHCESSLKDEVSNRSSWPSEPGSSHGSGHSTSNSAAGSQDRLDMASLTTTTPSEPSGTSFGTATIVPTFTKGPSPIISRRVPLLPEVPPRPITPPPEGDRVTSALEICIVCLSSIKYLPEKPPTSSCTHQSQVCRPCLARTIDSVVQNGDLVENMRCPTTDCRVVLEYTDVQTWATGDEEGIEQLFENYQAKLIRRTLNAEEDFVWCLRAGCNSGQYHTGGDERPMITCIACKTKQCFRHKTLWHDGVTCLQWDLIGAKNAYSDALSRKKIVSSTKPCPGAGCKMRVEKNGGCYTMTCATSRGCGTYYCWECLAIGCAHYDSCAYYNGQPGQNPAPPAAIPALESELEIVAPPESRSRAKILAFTKRLWFWKTPKEAPGPSLPAPDDPLAFKIHEI